VSGVRRKGLEPSGSTAAGTVCGGQIRVREGVLSAKGVSVLR